MEAVFRARLHRTRKRENPESSFYRIVSGSSTDPSWKLTGNRRFPAEPDQKSSYSSRMSATKTRFRGITHNIIQYLSDHGKTNKENLFKDLSETYFIFRYFLDLDIRTNRQ